MSVDVADPPGVVIETVPGLRLHARPEFGETCAVRVRLPVKLPAPFALTVRLVGEPATSVVPGATVRLKLTMLRVVVDVTVLL